MHAAWMRDVLLSCCAAHGSSAELVPCSEAPLLAKKTAKDDAIPDVLKANVRTGWVLLVCKRTDWKSRTWPSVVAAFKCAGSSVY